MAGMTEMVTTANSLRDQCLGIYVWTNEFYRKVCADHGLPDFGFEVLYGPPILGAEILFIGYQPSFAELDTETASCELSIGCPLDLIRGS